MSVLRPTVSLCRGWASLGNDVTDWTLARELLKNTQEAYLDAREEVQRLRLENSRLEHANRVLSEKLASSFPSDLAQLPHEILLLVLRYALPPRWLLSGIRELIPQSIYSIDLSMKLSILVVCKVWHQVGIELLYESVFLRNIGQLPAFVRALEGRDLGPLVRNVDLSCMVPRGYSALFQSETRKLFQLCPRLSHFGFVPPFLIPPFPDSLPVMSHSITSLEFSRVVNFGLILLSLDHLCDSLRFLALPLPPSEDIEEYATDVQLNFPQLEELRVHLNPEPDSDLEPSVPSVWNWSMPGLRRMWLTATFPDRIRAEMLLDVYGQNLTFLSIFFWTDVQALLDRCPSLEHLVIGNPTSTASLLKHQKIKHLDLWWQWHARAVVEPDKPTLESARIGFPALCSCRYLDVTFNYLWDLPLRFPPNELPPRDEARIAAVDAPDVFSGDADNESGKMDEDEEMKEDLEDSEVRANDFIGSSWLAAILEYTDPQSMNGRALPEVDLSDDEDGYQSFVVNATFGNESDPEDYSDSDSDAGSCVTVSEDGGYLVDQFYTGVDQWEVDRDEALEIFSRVRRSSRV
ncbi:hypothetical protein C8R44DRAFT_763181 [Mycena epipterygia]|nr:hypothetical protein C8R44DRAFT_763181 [Mycena epipterygia]